MNQSLLVVLGIVGIMAIAMAFSAERTGLATYPVPESDYRICPPGMTTVLYSVPGGGNQVVDCVDEDVIVGGFGGTFDTYGNDPRGDLRRQAIAQYGYPTAYNPYR